MLVANDQTLFNFLMPDLSRAQIRTLDQRFRRFLASALGNEALGEASIEKILNEYQIIGYANSSSRSVLGSLNDLVTHYKYYVLSDGGLSQCDLPAIIKRLNRMPMGAIGYQNGIDALKQCYGIV